MFRHDNYNFAGVHYDYDALNALLAAVLASGDFGPADDLDAIKTASDWINNNQTTLSDGRIVCRVAGGELAIVGWESNQS